MGRLPRRIILASVAVLALAGVFAASAALAENRSADDATAPAAVDDAQPRPPGRGKGERLAQAIRNTMRVSRDIYVDGRTVTVTTDRGELVSVGEGSLKIKYRDGAEADVQVVGEVKVCASGNPNAGLGDLQTGKPVGINKATNLPGGDLTVVVQVTEKPKDELKGCKELLESVKEKLKAPATL